MELGIRIRRMTPSHSPFQDAAARGPVLPEVRGVGGAEPEYYARADDFHAGSNRDP